MDDLTLHFSGLEPSLGYSFKNKELLAQAFIHRSFLNENRDWVGENNERLEFLGDAILGFLIADYLYRQFPKVPEGTLSNLKARLVEAHSCARFLVKLGAAPFVLLGKGEKMNEGKGREGILADLFEALIGAIYLDGGMETLKKVFWSHLEEEISSYLRNPIPNWKAELQEYLQKKHKKSPTYRLIEQKGPDHNRVFLIAAYLNEDELARGSGFSKKEAEQQAAKNALEELRDKD